jgi:hypothetical protein
VLARECRSAANRTFTNNGATVDSAPGGDTVFRDNSTAGSATLIANGGTNGGLGGTIRFEDNSNGGKSRVMVSGNGTLDVSNHNSGLFTIGSIEGDGRVSLGDGLIFQIGGNDQNSTFSGDIAGRNLVSTWKKWVQAGSRSLGTPTSAATPRFSEACCR